MILRLSGVAKVKPHEIDENVTKLTKKKFFALLKFAIVFIVLLVFPLVFYFLSKSTVLAQETVQAYLVRTIDVSQFNPPPAPIRPELSIYLTLTDF